MSVFSSSMNHRSFLWQISVLCFILGLILAVAVTTSSQFARDRVAINRPGFTVGIETRLARENQEKNSQEISKLRTRVKELEDTLAQGSGAAKRLNKALQEMKVLASLTPVQGSGVVVTLRNSTKPTPLGANPEGSIIHDTHLLIVVNELRAAGAEAIAVNGERIASVTALRCVGPLVQINNKKYSSPYIVQAIGDPETMRAALQLKDGVLDNIGRLDPDMTHITKEANIEIPAFTGTTSLSYIKPMNPEKDKK